MNRDANDLIDEAIRARFSGWDFSWLHGRMSEADPPWDYEIEASQRLATAHQVLDVDTGGGELLARMGPFAGIVVATEGYRPNVEVAARTLRPLGVEVVAIESAPDNIDQTVATPTSTASHLPFTAGAFDLVLNRHSSYWPTEVARVLRAGGSFLTQQRGVGENALLERFGRTSSHEPAFDLRFAVHQLEAAGLEIVRAEEVTTTPITFLDVGALTYFLRAAPWVVPDFDAQEDRGALHAIHTTIEHVGRFDVAGSHRLIVALRP